MSRETRMNDSIRRPAGTPPDAEDQQHEGTHRGEPTGDDADVAYQRAGERARSVEPERNLGGTASHQRAGHSDPLAPDADVAGAPDDIGEE